jgi:hypothetical protein
VKGFENGLERGREWMCGLVVVAQQIFFSKFLTVVAEFLESTKKHQHFAAKPE